MLAPPDLIAMRWDFDDGVTPVPGRQIVGYSRFFACDDGCHVEVHQRAADAKQAEFLTAVWSMVLGRFTGLHRPRPSRPEGEATQAPRLNAALAAASGVTGLARAERLVGPLRRSRRGGPS